MYINLIYYTYIPDIQGIQNAVACKPHCYKERLAENLASHCDNQCVCVQLLYYVQTKESCSKFYTTQQMCMRKQLVLEIVYMSL